MNKFLIIIILLLTGKVACAQNHKIENLVFEGAGIRGIAYFGVLKELEKQQVINGVKKVGGTSAGAITALMVSLGYTSNEIYNIISNTKFQKFNDGEFIFIGGFSRLNSKYGWYKGDEFSKWLEVIIAEKSGDSEITFTELEQLGFKQLYVTATCMNKQKLITFSAETYPQMKIRDAIRISMSIPLYFEAVFIDNDGNVYDKQNEAADLDVVVDGGILGNYPIFMFDSLTVDSLNNPVRIPNCKTVGIRIDSDKQIKSDSMTKELVPIPINSMNDYIEAFYILILENLNRISLVSTDWERTISVSSEGIGPRIKKLTIEQKETLINSGENSTRKYLNNL